MKKKSLVAFFAGIAMAVFAVNAFAQNKDFEFNKVEGETIAVFAPLVDEKTVPFQDRQWLSDVVQGKLVNAFYTYSNFVPFDQGVINIAVNQIRESQQNAAYDTDTMLEAGRYVMAKYYAYVSITYLPSGQYDMTFYIIDIETSDLIASVSEPCTREQLRVKNKYNAIYQAIYKMLSRKKVAHFQKTENWPELEEFLEVSKGSKKKTVQPSAGGKNIATGERIAVFNPIFKNCSQSDIDAFNQVLRGRLVTALLDYSMLRPFDGTTQVKMLETIKGSSDSIYDETTVLQAGRMANATYMCYVKIIKIGNDQYNIYYNLLHTSTGVPWATFEDDCNYAEIVNINQNSISNRAVFKMLKYDLGPSAYDAEELAQLEKDLADQQKNSSKYKAAADKAAREEEEKSQKAQAEARKIAEKEAAERRKQEEKERKAAAKADRKANSSFMANQHMNPTSGIDISMGMNTGSMDGVNYLSAMDISMSTIISPTPFWGVGVRMDVIPINSYTYYDIVAQVDCHLVIGSFLAPYLYGGLGFGMISEMDDSVGLSASAGAGLYLMFGPMYKIHAEYGIVYNPSPLGWNDRFCVGFTWNLFGGL